MNNRKLYTPRNKHKKWKSIEAFLQHGIMEDQIRDAVKSGWIKEMCNKPNFPHLEPHISKLHKGRNEEHPRILGVTINKENIHTEHPYHSKDTTQ